MKYFNVLFLIFLLFSVSFADDGEGEDGEDGETCANHDRYVWILNSITADGETKDVSSYNLWYSTDNTTSIFTDGCRTCTYNVDYN